MPDIRTDPLGWFKVVDLDGDGRLSRDEVVEVLKAQLPIDIRSFEREAANGQLWGLWDKDGNGYLDQQEIVGEGGVVAYVQSVFTPSAPATPIPDIQTNRIAWFKHFDEDDSGSLDKGEVIRALIKTLALSLQKMDALHEMSEASDLAVYPCGQL